MPIRNNVTFRHPAPLVAAADAEGIISSEGAGWFVDLLRAIPRLVVDATLCQEDWGVVVFGMRDGFHFWFGLSFADEGDRLPHVHHWRILQRFRASGKAAYAAVIAELHRVLANEPAVGEVKWFSEAEIDVSDARGAATPDE